MKIVSGKTTQLSVFAGTLTVLDVIGTDAQKEQLQKQIEELLGSMGLHSNSQLLSKRELLLDANVRRCMDPFMGEHEPMKHWTLYMMQAVRAVEALALSGPSSDAQELIKRSLARLNSRLIYEGARGLCQPYPDDVVKFKERLAAIN